MSHVSNMSLLVPVQVNHMKAGSILAYNYPVNGQLKLFRVLLLRDSNINFTDDNMFLLMEDFQMNSQYPYRNTYDTYYYSHSGHNIITLPIYNQNFNFMSFRHLEYVWADKQLRMPKQYYELALFIKNCVQVYMNINNKRNNY